MAKSASMEGIREEGTSCKKSVKECRKCLLFCLLLHFDVNPHDGELYLLTTSKVRKEIFRPFAYMMGLGHFLTKVTGTGNLSQAARQEEGGAGTWVSSPTRASRVNNYSAKKLQRRMPVPPNQFAFIFPYYLSIFPYHLRVAVGHKHYTVPLQLALLGELSL